MAVHNKHAQYPYWHNFAYFIHINGIAAGILENGDQQY